MGHQTSGLQCRLMPPWNYMLNSEKKWKTIVEITFWDGCNFHNATHSTISMVIWNRPFIMYKEFIYTRVEFSVCVWNNLLCCVINRMYLVCSSHKNKKNLSVQKNTQQWPYLVTNCLLFTTHQIIKLLGSSLCQSWRNLHLTGTETYHIYYLIDFHFHAAE